MNSGPVNPIPTREEEVNRFMELREILEKLFKWLFGVTVFIATPKGEALVTEHPNLMTVMVFMIVLYFLMWLLGTMLPDNFMIILVCIMVVIASVSSVLVLTTIPIPSLLLWLSVMGWVGVLALIVYVCYQELYSLVVRAILGCVKNLIDGYRMQGSRLPV
ncbi:hypothetical protein LR48_Vigan05g129000 [Vigna angularis]|uniref:Uncharacterized protein n=1 Tax=Phaseolus angularis TaxID=3914 RepID=A0A0L9ULA4_PHAAN|nr:uncharacterized protein LOC108333783 [Vigna angularis]KAG2371892.1 uncharacterized protein HKW66_Vig0240130 [Vigna angularis]KOM43685.1 hypothetical protein LR48_Vigan05g129000 [Vigna angularis]